MTRRQALLFLMVIVLVGGSMSAIIILQSSAKLFSLGLERPQWLMLAPTILPIIGIPTFLTLSDWIGRRALIMISLGAMLLQLAILLFADSIPGFTALFSLYLLSGSFTSAANSYGADLTTPENRAQVFVTIGSVWMLGFLVGNYISNIGDFNYESTPLYFVIGLLIILITVVYFQLPESLKQENRRPFTIKEGNVVTIMLLLFQKRTIALLAIVGLMIYTGMYATSIVQGLYMMFRSQDTNFSLVGSAFTAKSAFVVLLAGISALLLPSMGKRKLLVMSLAISAIAMLLFTFAPDPYFRTVALLTSFAGLGGSIIVGFISAKTAPDMQGTVIGATEALILVSHFIGQMNALLFTYIKDHNPNYIFLVTVIPGLLLLLSILILTNIPEEETN